jgi:hypothetical protein
VATWWKRHGRQARGRDGAAEAALSACGGVTTSRRQKPGAPNVTLRECV